MASSLGKAAPSLRKAVRSVAINALLARERWQSGVAYNPLSDRVARDPYPVYAKLRARDPVHYSRLMDAWVFTPATGTRTPSCATTGAFPATRANAKRRSGSGPPCRPLNT